MGQTIYFFVKLWKVLDVLVREILFNFHLWGFELRGVNERILVIAHARLRDALDGICDLVSVPITVLCLSFLDIIECLLWNIINR